MFGGDIPAVILLVDIGDDSVLTEGELVLLLCAVVVQSAYLHLCVQSANIRNSDIQRATRGT